MYLSAFFRAVTECPRVCLTPSLVHNPVSLAVRFDNATSARDLFHPSERDTLSNVFICIFFTFHTHPFHLIVSLVGPDSRVMQPPISDLYQDRLYTPQQAPSA